MNSLLWKNLLRWLPWLAVVVLGLALLFVFVPETVAVAKTGAQYGLAGPAVAVVIFLITLFAVAPRRSVYKAADELAGRLRLRYEHELRIVSDPRPLLARWTVRTAGGSRICWELA